jgi:hypothetical protein
MVDVHGDTRLADHRRFDAAAPRRLEMRKIAVVAEPERHRIGWRADDGIGAEIVVRRRNREGRCREMRRHHPIDLRRRGGGNVGRQRDHAAAAFPGEQFQSRGHAAGMTVAGAVGHDARAQTGRERRCLGIERDDQKAGEAFGAGDCYEHFAHHHLDQRAPLGRREQGRETLLGAVQLLDRHDCPDVGRRAHVRESAKPRTVRASRSRSSSVVIKVWATCSLARTPSASALSTT